LGNLSQSIKDIGSILLVKKVEAWEKKKHNLKVKVLNYNLVS